MGGTGRWAGPRRRGRGPSRAWEPSAWPRHTGGRGRGPSPCLVTWKAEKGPRAPGHAGAGRSTTRGGQGGRSARPGPMAPVLRASRRRAVPRAGGPSAHLRATGDDSKPRPAARRFRLGTCGICSSRCVTHWSVPGVQPALAPRRLQDGGGAGRIPFPVTVERKRGGKEQERKKKKEKPD